MASGPTPPEVEARLRAFLRGELKGPELEAFERDLDANPALLARLGPVTPGTTVVAEGPTLGAGAALSRLQQAPARERLKLGASIGQGGMARVLSATQPALGRAVAVKMAPLNAEPWVSDQLLQEARLTGALEHPGIVPVHDLLTDEAGQVQVVLKRIEGESWSALITNPDAVRARFGQDPIEWNVGVAMQVCRAMGFAHQRGVLHRDVKPANVMVGQFGEVYLLDWGVAGTLVPDPAGLLPCVADVAFAGTLNFMAPEQVLADVAQLGPWTDTYLLGGCLYTALYGVAPHGGTVQERRAQPWQPAVCSETQWLARELVAIVRKALQPDPKARYLTAEELRADLETFLRHRDGRRLTERATAQMVLARLARERGDRAAAERAATQAEFGCRAALELWPDDVVAHNLLADVGAERVNAALAAGDPQGAERLLVGLAAAPPALKEKVAAAVRAQSIERERLARIEHDADRFVGLAAKRWLLAVFGLAWLGFWWGVALWPPATAMPLLMFFVGYGSLGTAAALWLRDVMLKQRLNREMLLVQGAMQVASAALAAVGQAWGLPVEHVIALMMLLWSLGMAAVAAIIEPASLIPAVGWMVAFVTGALWPSALRPALFLGTLLHVVAPLAVSLRLKRASGST